MKHQDRKKRRKIYRWAALVLVIVLGVAGCGDIYDAYRTVNSLRRVDDYPLYVMHYYGEIGYKDFQTGKGVDGIWKMLRDRHAAEAMGSPDRTANDLENRRTWACTCFTGLSKEGDKVYGRNFDWSTKAALMLFTDPPDGYASVSMVDITYLGIGSDGIRGLKSLSMLAAPHMPFDGMNECGLAIGVMATPRSDVGKDPAKDTIGSACLMREILNHAKNIREAITMLEGYNVVFKPGPPLHYLISDRDGNSAVVEFLDGRPTVIPNTDPWQAVTNFILAGRSKEDSLAACWRYCKVYQTLEQLQGKLSTDQTMELLKQVSQPGWTAWSIVYGLDTGRGQIAMGRNRRRIYEFQLARKDDESVKSDVWPKPYAKATRPTPAHGTNVHPDAKLKLDWIAGATAKTHRVFWGTDKENLTLLAEVTRSKQVKLPKLKQGVTYYWRVDEVDADSAATAGDLWRFSVGSLEGWWKLDGDIKDSSGNDHHGISAGDPKWTAGRKGEGLELNGEDDIIDLGEAVELPAWTIAIWVKSQKPTDAPIGLPFNGGTQFNMSWNHPDGFYRGVAAMCVADKWYPAGFGQLEPNTWHHLCATYDGETLKAYRNGSLVSANPDPYGRCDTNDRLLHAGGRHFSGSLDDLRIYSYVLSEREIKRLAR